MQSTASMTSCWWATNHTTRLQKLKKRFIIFTENQFRYFSLFSSIQQK